jgi:two-component system sensor histidine kinase BaeS
MPIHKKLVLIFLAFSAALIISMASLVKWSFHRSFLDYIQQQHIEMLQNTAPALENHYSRVGSWDRLSHHPRQLKRLVAATFIRGNAPDERGQAPPSSAPSAPGRKMPSGPRSFLSSVYLLDAEQKTVVEARRPPSRHQHLQPIRVNGVVVGYLGATLPPHPTSMIDQRFAQDQSKHLLLIGLLAFLFSIIFAWPISRFVVNRIKTLDSHIKQLSQGEFEQRITVAGKDELSALAEHLNNLAFTLQQSAQSQRKWIADISHELRTPLATLRAQLEAIEDGVHQYNTATHTRLNNQVLRLHQLVEDLYQLSLTDAGALQYRKQHIDIAQLLDSAVQPFELSFEKRRITLEQDNRVPSGTRWFADPERLHQLLANLLQNSLRYTDSPGKTLVSTSLSSDNLRLSVEDSAPGVDKSLHHRLFERLYRAESSRNRTFGGAGLGLSLCRNIVLAHEGKIDIDDSHLGGLKVTMTFPLADTKGSPQT